MTKKIREKNLISGKVYRYRGAPYRYLKRVVREGELVSLFINDMGKELTAIYIPLDKWEFCQEDNFVFGRGKIDICRQKS